MTRKELDQLNYLCESSVTLEYILEDIEKGYWLKIVTPNREMYASYETRNKLVELINQEKDRMKERFEALQIK